MPTFTDPVVLTSSAGNTTFTLQNSRQVGKSFITTWKDLVAAQAVAAQLKTKFDESNVRTVRGVAQVTIPLPITDGSLEPATFNISYVAHREHVIASLDDALELLLDAATEANFRTKFLQRI